MTGGSGRNGAPEPARSGRYELREQIGAGGMGRVYRAHDLLLNREVAVKFLPEWLAEDEAALQRFRREALATASLNHPNVLAIHDQTVIGGRPCLVTELLEGRTLRSVLAGGAVPVPEAVDYAQQVLEGLAAAHDKGIVHRDLKPENLFLTNDGRVKILDFGLAKQVVAPADADAETVTAIAGTRGGVVLGTIGYQSPEQARGEGVDVRSDLFAFGAVFYELLTGRPAFRRQTQADSIAAVLDSSPSAPSSVNQAVPLLCDHIVAKALEKDCELRYQSVAELKADLRRVRRELTGATTNPTGAATAMQSPRKSRVAILVLLSAAIVALVGIGLVLSVQRAARNPFEGVAARQLTNATGWEGEPSVSPDATSVAYSAEADNGTRHIFVTDTRTGVPLQLTRGEGDDRYPCWTPDGSTIYFSSDRGEGGIFAVSRFGSDAPRLIVADAVQPAISADGGNLAFARRVGSGYSVRIFVAPLADPARARAVTADSDGLWEHERPSWSPDGRSIVYRAHNAIWRVNPGRPGATRLTAENQTCDRPVWAPDGSIYYGSKLAGSFAIWRLPADSAAAKRVTFGTGEREPSVSGDGRVLAYTIANDDYNLVLHDLRSGAEQRYGGVRQEYLGALSPDGNEAFFVGDLDAAGEQIWAVKIADGKFVPDTARRVTEPPGHPSHVSCSRDGRWLLYFNVIGERRNIWVVATSGGVPRQVTNGQAPDLVASWSPNGRRIAFMSERDGRSHIWTMAMAEGKPAGDAVRLTSGGATDEAPVWSTDGRTLAFVRGESDGAREVWLVPSDGQGEARRVTSGARAARLQWEPGTGKLLVAAWWTGTRLSIRRVDPKTGATAALQPPLLLGRNPFLPDFDVSSDGCTLLFSRDDSRSDIWLLDNRRDGR